jgi:hypothetical protein
VLAISKLAAEERLAVGPARTMFRRKRRRAIEIFQARFGKRKLVEAYGAPRLPRI